MKKLTLVKFGGAVITNKEIPNQGRLDVVSRLVAEIKAAQLHLDSHLILGNGVGSYAHVPAAHYQTMAGFINSDSKIGMAITQDGAAQSNRVVVKECINQGLPAVTVSMANSLITNQRQADVYFLEVLEQYLESGLLPVTHGDVIADRHQGCTVWSTDKIFTFLARKLSEKGWQIDQIIHVTEAEGVWKMTNGQLEMKDGEKVIYPIITPDMKAEVAQSMTDIKGFDVTGGMWHKIEESLSLTDLGITTRIISGLKPGALYNALMGDNSQGTLIKSVTINTYDQHQVTSPALSHHHGWQSAVGAAA